MINAVAKSGNLYPYLKHSSQIVSGNIRENWRPVLKTKKVVVDRPAVLSSNTLNNILARRDAKVAGGPTVPFQVRLAHTDITVPDFSHYRRESTSDPSKRASESETSRKSFAYLVTGGCTMGAIYMAKQTVQVFVSSMSASADVLAMSTIEVNLNEIPEGKSVTFKWRGKPLFIRHRSIDEIKKEEAVAVSELRDPQTDSERVQKPEWLIIVGICTHLGCVPIANAGDFGGYYCPCHGSHYDASGRIRKGPAPLNLEVPPYTISESNTLVVG